jgi:enamine deaminase RidA (YjgF/YER057c/UK114 family)
MTGAAALAMAGARSQARSQPNDRSQDMASNVRFSSPETMQKPPGYSHVVEVNGPGRTIYFAGQLGIDKSGRTGATAREQMEIAFQNVKAALDSVGASFSDIVKLNSYIVDIGTNIAHYREVRDKFVNTSAPPEHGDRRAATGPARGAFRNRGDCLSAAEISSAIRIDQI